MIFILLGKWRLLLFEKWIEWRVQCGIKFEPEGFLTWGIEPFLGFGPCETDGTNIAKVRQYGRDILREHPKGLTEVFVGSFFFFEYFVQYFFFSGI